jgi:anti-sigma B factor antagonist
MAKIEPSRLEINGPSSITVKTQTEGGTPVVSLSGELDLTNIEPVRSSIGAVLTAGTERLVVELSGLAFMDSSGLALLASFARKIPEIEVRDPTPIVRRLIDLSGLAAILNVSP